VGVVLLPQSCAFIHIWIWRYSLIIDDFEGTKVFSAGPKLHFFDLLYITGMISGPPLCPMYQGNFHSCLVMTNFLFDKQHNLKDNENINVIELNFVYLSAGLLYLDTLG